MDSDKSEVYAANTGTKESTPCRERKSLVVTNRFIVLG